MNKKHFIIIGLTAFLLVILYGLENHFSNKAAQYEQKISKLSKPNEKVAREYISPFQVQSVQSQFTKDLDNFISVKNKPYATQNAFKEINQLFFNTGVTTPKESDSIKSKREYFNGFKFKISDFGAVNDIDGSEIVANVKVSKDGRDLDAGQQLLEAHVLKNGKIDSLKIYSKYANGGRE